MEKGSLVLIESDKITEKVQIVLRQTDYTEEVALEKLKEKNYDEIATIRAYFGIAEKKAPPVKSVNQEIYKQLRTKLDSSMFDYRQKLDTDESKK